MKGHTILVSAMIGAVIVLAVGFFPAPAAALTNEEGMAGGRGWLSSLYDLIKSSIFGHTEEARRIPIKEREEIERTKEKILNQPYEQREPEPEGWLSWLLLKLSQTKDSIFGGPTESDELRKTTKTTTTYPEPKAGEYIAECKDAACRMKNKAALEGRKAAGTAKNAKDTLAESAEHAKDKAEEGYESAKEYLREKGESIKEKAEDLKESAYATKEGVKGKVEGMKDAIKEKASNVKEGIKRKAEDVKEDIEEGLANVRDTIKGKVEGAKEYAHSTKEDLERRTADANADDDAIEEERVGGRGKQQTIHRKETETRRIEVQ